MVVTVSDTRDLASDRSGQRATDLLTEGGHEVRRREIVADDRDAIAALVRAGIADPEIDAVVLTGGTGIAPRDVTYEAVDGRLEKPLHGFASSSGACRTRRSARRRCCRARSAASSDVPSCSRCPASDQGLDARRDVKPIAPELGHMIGLLAP